jgi:hypothetical protein
VDCRIANGVEGRKAEFRCSRSGSKSTERSRTMNPKVYTLLKRMHMVYQVLATPAVVAAQRPYHGSELSK